MANGQTWDIFENDGLLNLQVPGQPPIPLYPGRDTDFVAKAVRATLSFSRNEANRVAGLTLKQNDVEITGRVTSDQ